MEKIFLETPKNLILEKLNIKFDIETDTHVNVEVSFKMSKNFLNDVLQGIINFGSQFAEFGGSLFNGELQKQQHTHTISIDDLDNFLEFLYHHEIETPTFTKSVKSYFVDYLRNKSEFPANLNEDIVLDGFKKVLEENKLLMINNFLKVNGLVAFEWFKYINSEPKYNPRPVISIGISTEKLYQFISKDKENFLFWFNHAKEEITFKDFLLLSEDEQRENYISYIASDTERYKKFINWLNDDGN